MEYDAVDNQIVITDALNFPTVYAYDALQRLTHVTDPQSNVTIYGYDSVGNNIALTDAKGNTTQYIYNAKEQLVQVIDALGNATEYSYDPRGNLITVIDANNHGSSYHYDNLGRLISETDPLGNTIDYGYDAVGNTTVITKATGVVLTNTYDALNRLVFAYRPDGTTAYTYNAVSNRVTMHDNTGVTSYTYDALDRLTSITQPDGQLLAYTYDAVGNRLSITYPEGGIVSYSFDDVNRLLSVHDWSGAVSSFTYTARNQLASQNNANNTNSIFEYDSAGRLTKITHSNSSGVFNTIEYTLDGVGNRVAMADSNGLTSYSYDVLHRLVSATYPDGEIVTYSYDAVGNRVSMTSSVSGTTTYTYDAANQILQAGPLTFTWDENGNLLTKGDVAMMWDTLGRLSQVVDGPVTTTFTYNGDGVRMAKNSNGQITTYVQDLSQALPLVLAESIETNTTNYVYGVHLLTAYDSAAAVSHFHHDGLGSVRQITDGSGNLLVSYEYDAYGAVRNMTGSSTNPFQFTGEQVDDETGLVFLRARYYDPATGRFLSRDPVRGSLELPQTINPYVYVENRPINFIDPAGTTAKDSAGRYGGGGVGGGGGGWGMYSSGTGSFDGIRVPWFWQLGKTTIALLTNVNPQFGEIGAVKWFRRLDKSISTINDAADVYQFSQERKLDAAEGLYGPNSEMANRRASGISTLYAWESFGCIGNFTPWCGPAKETRAVSGTGDQMARRAGAIEYADNPGVGRGDPAAMNELLDRYQASQRRRR